MDFSFGPSARDYKEQARQLLAEELTPERMGRVHHTGTFHDRDFHRALAARGWLAPGWPVELGGRGLDALEVLAFSEELAEAGAPMYGAATTMMIAGVIREVGTDGQRTAIIPRALNGEILIVLGFTEPECGSDVAAVATRAVRQGDQWVINGQKMFTTNAHVADYVFLLARTDPDALKHKGLTTFLVPLDQPGVTIQAVMTMSGERTNVTYYDDVPVDDAWRIGAVNDGWNTMSVALTRIEISHHRISNEPAPSAASTVVSWLLPSAGPCQPRRLTARPCWTTRPSPCAWHGLRPKRG